MVPVLSEQVMHNIKGGIGSVFGLLEGRLQSLVCVLGLFLKGLEVEPRFAIKASTHDACPCPVALEG